MKNYSFVIILVSAVVLFLTGCPEGSEEENLVLSASAFELANETDADDPINRVMTVTVNDTYELHFYTFTATNRDQHGEVITSGITHRWWFEDTSNFAFDPNVLFDGDDPSCRVIALDTVETVLHYEATQGTTTIESDTYTIIGYRNLEWHDYKRFANGSYEYMDALEQTGKIGAWFSSGFYIPATITQGGNITWEEKYSNSTVSTYTGSQLPNGDLSGTYDGAYSGDWYAEKIGQ